MASYMQTTIHSRISKLEKNHGDGTMGRIIRGTTTASHEPHRKKIVDRSLNNDPLQEIIDVPNEKSSEQIPQNIKFMKPKKSSQMLSKKTNDFILFESSIFPAIYFKKTTMRSVLKQFIFPSKCKSLPPNDDRTPLTFQIIANLFNQIVFSVFNLLVAQDTVNKSYYVFFSDSETIPFTKCCQSPVHIQMQINGTGKVMCNSPKCSHPSLAEFLISYEDGRKLWKQMTFLSSAPEKDQHLKNRISRYIGTGKYKVSKLNKLVNQTSKEVENIFQKSKFDDLMFQVQAESKNQHSGIDQNEQTQDNFITNPDQTWENRKKQNIATASPQKQNQEEDDIQDIIDPTEKNIDLLKVKIYYMAKKQKNIKNKFSKSIVEDSKVFHKRFEMIEKIDELLGGGNESAKGKDSKGFNRTKINFPKIMDQIKTRQQRRAKSMSRTQGKSFKISS